MESRSRGRVLGSPLSKFVTIEFNLVIDCNFNVIIDIEHIQKESKMCIKFLTVIFYVTGKRQESKGIRQWSIN